ncbi:MAG: C4-type zinc ribbon domain-containing protein [Elusimicrobia bacterium]|nr:C4-type zinc ribbon domain-containing protein [Elusimicrobiota bacterium]
MTLYSKIKERKTIVLVKVENSACGGCHASVRPQKINEILKEDKIVQCENCSRFLYIKDEGNAF